MDSRAGIEKLEFLQAHENSKIHLKASKLLDKFFSPVAFVKDIVLIQRQSSERLHHRAGDHNPHAASAAAFAFIPAPLPQSGTLRHFSPQNPIATYFSTGFKL